MTADVNGTLTGHVLADFIHDVRDRQFTLVGITAAGINQLFVLAKNFTGFWFNVHGVTAEKRIRLQHQFGIVTFLSDAASIRPCRICNRAFGHHDAGAVPEAAARFDVQEE